MKECQQCKSCFTDEVTVCPHDGMPTLHTISGEPVLEGKYHLERRLGQGGMGVVYCAKHAYLKTSHAIKIILPDLVGNDPQLVQRFRQEALAAAAIRHHNVVSVTDYGVAQSTMPFLVMEYVEGESLHDLLEREKKLSPPKALELMSAIAAGIGAAHRQGIVHRDLKPLNIMLLKNKAKMGEAVKILDFGLAKIKSGELLGSFVQAQTTGLMGSPYYMAPEQWSDEEPDARSDIYSLGVMLFQIIAGDVPFKGGSIPAIMKKHLSDVPPALANFGVSAPPAYESAIRRALAKNPADRPASVEEFVGELNAALSQITGNLGNVTIADLAASELQILTVPPHSQIYIDNAAAGESRDDGWLLLEGVQSGRHHLRVRHQGFEDWTGEIVCDGEMRQIVAKLNKSESASLPPRATATMPQIAPENTPPSEFAVTRNSIPLHHATTPQIRQTNFQEASAPVIAPVKKSGFPPVLIGIIGIGGLFLLLLIGTVSAYLFGGFDRKPVAGNANQNIVQNANRPANIAAPPDVPAVKNEMVKIAGGKFTMGRDDGAPAEQPAHEVSVGDFRMDKTEVTNAEYYDFVKAENYEAPAHWSNGKPISGEENFPVTRVSMADVKAFAAWRSKRDGAIYRLPTEAEWEYAARNGNSENLYPWGDEWRVERAVVEQNAPRDVGSIQAGANKAGVMDLIGNAWEWTSSPPAVYPNSPYKIERTNKNELIIRGGGFVSQAKGDQAVTATTRRWVEENRRDGFLGFRLVRSE